MQTGRPWLIITSFAILGLTVWSACGGASHNPSPSPTEAPVTSVSPPSFAATQSANALVETATDNKFSQTSLSIHAGQAYTLTLVNKGQAVHNLRLDNVKAPDGKDVAVPLVEPGKSGYVSFTVAKSGTYQFVCDVHPTEMRGTITVDQG